jgi:parallel beta-helix repeat protein
MPSITASAGCRPICAYSNAAARVMAALVVAVILVITGSIAAWADTSTLYVDNGNPNCSPSGPGTPDHPFCTIIGAAGVATAGTTVVVSSGTYGGPVNPSSSGTASAPIVFAAAPGASVTLTGGTYGFYLSGKSYLTVRGFNITGTSQAGIHVTGSNNVTLSGNHVSYAGQPVSGQTAAGIRLTNTASSLVEANTVDHNTLAGIYLDGGTAGVRVLGNQAYMNAAGWSRLAPGIDVRSSGNTVANNVSHDNEDSGLQFYTGGSNSLVVNNVAYNNGDHGIDDLNVTGQRIIGNTIYNNVTAGINVEASTVSSATVENNISVDNGINSPRTTSNIRIDSLSTSGSTVNYNLVSLRTPATMYVWGKTGYASLAAFQQATGQEAKGLQADPRWVASGAGDFHLSAGSPAIDSADSAVSGEQTTDLEGNGRIDDPGMANTGAGARSYDDRGAYEFQGATDNPPTAALSVRPASGAAPLAVTADASGSTDTDATPIDSYKFDFGDGSAAVGPQAGASASHTYSLAGSFTVTVTVNDTAGLSSTATSQVTVTNPSDDPPTAALSVTPGSGTTPVEVTADASGSSDGDATPIASYKFDFGDGSAAVGPQSEATATHTYTQGGTFTVTVTVKDTAGLSSTATSQVVVKQNLVGNSGFETDTGGWNTSGSGAGVSLARVAGGHSGGWAAKLTNGGTAGATCLLNDSPNWVATTATGTYTGSIWVRADGAGAVLNLRFREYSGTSLVGTKSTQVTLTTSWQLVTVAYTPVSPGSSNLDLNAYLTAASAPPGTCFYADDAVIARS